MAQSQLIINLVPNMLSVCLVSKNQVVQEEHLELDPSHWDETWADGILRLDQPLRQILSRFTSNKFPRATVYYHSPTLNQQVYSFDLSPTDAHDAGVAKIRETVGYNCAVESTPLWISPSSNESSMLVYADKEEQLRALFGWLNRCHLKSASFIPMSTAIMSTAASIATRSDEDTAVFYLGSDVSVIAFSNSLGLQVIRSAQIGYRTLIESYMQALQALDQSSGDDDQEEDTECGLERCKKSTSMLFEHGIPLGDSKVDGVDLRKAVLPILAPVLQRMCIEIKQTFRFGLNGQPMPQNLLLCGPGAQIPLLSKSLSQHIEMHIKISPAAKTYSPSAIVEPGMPEWDIIESQSEAFGLLPEAANEELLRNKLSRLAIAGAVSAGVFLGAEYGMTTIQQQSLTKTMQADANRLSAVSTFNQQVESVAQFTNLMNDVSGLVVETVKQTPQWHSVLSDLASLTSESIRIEEIRGDDANGESRIGINGLAVSVTEGKATKELNEFISSLEKMEGVEKVTLGATTRIGIGNDMWGRQLELHVYLVSTPLSYTVFLPENKN